MIRRFVAIATTAALGAAGLGVLTSTPASAHTQVTTLTMPCQAVPQTNLQGPQSAPTDATWTATAVDTVLVGQTFTISAGLSPIDVPLTNSGYTVNNIRALVGKVPDPSNATVNSVSLTGGSPGWAFSRSGGVTTITNNSSFAGGSTITVPTINYNVTATGAVGSNVDLRLGGAPTFNDTSNPSLNFTINLSGVPVLGTLDVILKCFAPGSPATLIHRTEIVPPDTTGPAITINTPASGASYAQGQSVSASYSCSDPSGVASCVGDLANGATVDTSTPGSYTFQVNAQDLLGNTSTRTVSYSVVNLPIVSVHGGTSVEGAGAQVPFTISLSKPADVTVDYETQDGSATEPGDYASTSGSVAFTSSGPLTATVPVDLANDSDYEAGEDFSVVVTSAPGIAIGPSAAGRIIDDDNGGPVSTECGSADEGSPITCEVTYRGHAHANPVTVNYQTSNGTASTPSDYTDTSGSFTFPPSSYPQTQSVVVTTATDAVYEGADYEQFTFTASAPGGGSDATSGTVIETAPVPTRVYIDDASVREGNGYFIPNQLHMRVTLDKPSAVPVTMELRTYDGAATGFHKLDPARDFVRKVSQQITFQPGVVALPFRFQIFGDQDNEGNEDFQVELRNITGGALVGDTQATMLIVDDDDPTSSALEITTSDVNVYEGDAATPRSAIVTVSLSKTHTAPVTLRFRTETVLAGATAGVDFTAVTNSNPSNYRNRITIAAGSLTGDAKVLLKPDVEREGDERLDVRIVSASAGTITKPVGSITILDDDPTAPGAPSNLVATTAVGVIGGVDLAWVAPTEDNGAAVIGYEYRVSTDGVLDAEVWHATPNGANTSTTDTLCGSGTLCTYEVRGVNRLGQGLGSNQTTGLGLDDNDPPLVVLNTPLSGTNVDSASTVSFGGDAGIADGDLVPVTVEVRKGVALVDTLNATEADGTFTATGGPYTDGIYTATALQSDWNANEGSSSVTFEVHNNAIFVAPSGNNANAGTAAAPKLTVAAAITAAGSGGEIIIGLGIYSEGTGIAPLGSQDIRGGFNQFSGWVRPGTGGSTGTPSPTGTTIRGVGQAVLSSASNVVIEALTVEGKNTGLSAGASVYGVRATGGSLTLSRVSVSAEDGIAAAASAAVGSNGASNGCNGNNGANAGSSSSTASCNAAATTGLRGGTGGNGGGFLGSGGAGGAGGVTTPVNEPGGSGGAAGSTGVACVGGQAAAGGSGGPGGVGGAAGAAAANDTGLAGATYVGRSGGTSGAGVYGRGGGGGGGGSCGVLFGNRASNGGGGGGGAISGGGNVVGGAPGGGSFAVYAFNATVTVNNSSLAAGSGGGGGKGGTGGNGANGGNGGTGGTSRGAGGGGGGGGGGAGGGGGGAGGPSIALFKAGTGTLTQSGNTLTRAVAAASGGAGGNAGNGGNGGNGGTGPGTGAAGFVGNAGNPGSAGQPGLLCSLNNAGSCTA